MHKINIKYYVVFFLSIAMSQPMAVAENLTKANIKTQVKALFQKIHMYGRNIYAIEFKQSVLNMKQYIFTQAIPFIEQKNKGKFFNNLLQQSTNTIKSSINNLGLFIQDANAEKIPNRIANLGNAMQILSNQQKTLNKERFFVPDRREAKDIALFLFDVTISIYRDIRTKYEHRYKKLAEFKQNITQKKRLRLAATAEAEAKKQVAEEQARAAAQREAKEKEKARTQAEWAKRRIAAQAETKKRAEEERARTAEEKARVAAEVEVETKKQAEIERQSAEREIKRQERAQATEQKRLEVEEAKTTQEKEAFKKADQLRLERNKQQKDAEEKRIKKEEQAQILKEQDRKKAQQAKEMREKERQQTKLAEDERIREAEELKQSIQATEEKRKRAETGRLLVEQREQETRAAEARAAELARQAEEEKIRETQRLAEETRTAEVRAEEAQARAAEEQKRVPAAKTDEPSYYFSRLQKQPSFEEMAQMRATQQTKQKIEPAMVLNMSDMARFYRLSPAQKIEFNKTGRWPLGY